MPDMQASVKYTIIVSDNTLSTILHQAITWTISDILWLRSYEKKFGEIGIKYDNSYWRNLI